MVDLVICTNSELQSTHIVGRDMSPDDMNTAGGLMKIPSVSRYYMSDTMWGEPHVDIKTLFDVETRIALLGVM